MVVRNKKTWYAHWGKPQHYWIEHEKYSHVTRDDLFNGFAYSFDYWWHNKWPGRVHDFKWLIEKFWPLPGWPDDWEQRQFMYRKR